MLSSSPSHFFLFFTDSPQYQTSLNSHVSYWLRNKDVCYPFLCSLSNIMTALSRYITPILPICCCNHCEHYPVTHLYIPSSANRIQFPSFCERFLWINFSMTPPHSKLSLAQPKTPFNQSWDHWFQNRFYTLLLDNLNSILTWTLSRAICRVFFILQRSTITEFPPPSTSYQSYNIYPSSSFYPAYAYVICIPFGALICKPLLRLYYVDAYSCCWYSEIISSISTPLHANFYTTHIYIHIH